MVSVIVAAVVIAISVTALVRRRDPARAALALKWAGFTVMALSTFVFGAFIVGDTIADPGGWRAVGLVALWAVPLAGLGMLAWRRPDWATCVFAALAAALIGVSGWFAADSQGLRALEDQRGPIRVIVTFVVVAPIALLGLRRTAAAGVLLLAAGLVPLAVSSLGGLLGLSSLSAVSAAPVVAGVLYLVSARLGGRPGAPARAENGSAQRPKAA